MAYDPGDTVPLTFEIRDANGALVDAASVTVTVDLPDGTTETPTPAHPSVGRYEVDYVSTLSGRYSVRGVSTSPATAFSDTFDVRPAAPAYVVSLADAKRHLNLPASTDTNDEELRGFIEAATEVVEELTGEVVTRRTVVERKAIRGAKVALSNVPVISLTSIAAVDGTWTSDPAGWDLDGETGILRALPGNPLWCGDAIITTVAGYELIPARYTRAALMILRHQWESQRASLGGGRGTPLGGRSDDDSFVYSQGYAIPRAAAELLGSRLPGIA